MTPSESPGTLRADQLQRNLLAVYVIWLRELKRFVRDTSRVTGALAQPALWLFVMGTGLGKGMMALRGGAAGGAAGAAAGADGFNYLAFIYPGIIGMTILFTSIFSAVSIVWDREFGFLKEVLVAPISRWAVALGKDLGGSTVALLQGMILLLFAPLVGVSLTPLKVIQMVAVMALTAFSLTSLGILVAARMRTMEGFQMIMNFMMMPLFFLSGAMFPVTNLPGWLSSLVHIDPLAYSVVALRFIVLADPRLQAYPLHIDVLVVAVFGLVAMTLAVWMFQRTE